MALTVRTLRELFRGLQAFQAAYESEGIEEIRAPDGTTWHLADVSYLYEQRYRLSPRQKQAIELCLVANVKEKHASQIMGVSSTNPVAMYATDGLKKLIELAEAGELPRFRLDPEGILA